MAAHTAPRDREASSCTSCLSFDNTHTTNTRMPWQNYFQALKPGKQREAVVEDHGFVLQLHLGCDFFAHLPCGTTLFPSSCSACLGTLLPAKGTGDGTVSSSSFSLMSFQGNICLATTASIGSLALTNQTESLYHKAFTTKTSYLGLNNMITNNP